MTRLFLLLLICCSAAPDLFGQSEFFYYGPNTRPVDGIEEAVQFEEMIRKSSRKYLIKTHAIANEEWTQVKKERIKVQGNGVLTIYYHTNSFFPIRIYREMEKIGPEKYFFTESIFTRRIRTGTSTSYLPLHLEGSVTEYHSNGEVKSVSEYQDNQLISNENWLPDGSKYIDSVFYSVDVEPKYQMGDDFFKAFLINKLGESKLDLSQIEDEVVIGWVVMETGEIEGAMALKGKSKELNKYIVNTIIELPGNWTPALLEGSPVRYFMSIPLNFIHHEASFQDIEFSSGVMRYNRY